MLLGHIQPELIVQHALWLSQKAHGHVPAAHQLSQGGSAQWVGGMGWKPGPGRGGVSSSTTTNILFAFLALIHISSTTQSTILTGLGWDKSRYKSHAGLVFTKVP